MQNATSVALSRLVAQQRALDVTAVNLANAGTPGFRAERVQFSDWLAQEPAAAVPPGIKTISFTQDRATWHDRQAGSLRQTANPLDVAISDRDGWFTVQTAGGTRLTRAGHFQLDSTGAVVDEAGNKLLSTSGTPLQTTPSDTQFSIAADGTLSSENGQIGKIAVVQPVDETKMLAEGSRLYVAGGATTPVTAPKLLQGAIEDSNVSPILEMNRMMNDLREFQFTSQMIQGESDRLNNAIDKILTRQSS